MSLARFDFFFGFVADRIEWQHGGGSYLLQNLAGVVVELDDLRKDGAGYTGVGFGVFLDQPIHYFFAVLGPMLSESLNKVLSELAASTARPAIWIT